MLSTKKIVITGPESSGKTTLTSQLAKHFSTAWTPEYARVYLQGLGRPYHRGDLWVMAQGQAAWEDEKSLEAHRLLFCDTGLEVIKIWSLFKYGQVDPRIETLLAERDYSAYLLCRPDLPWEADPLREAPGATDRWRLFQLYQGELRRRGLPWVEIGGGPEERLQTAVQTVEGWYDG